jgi:hypothetical protein
MEVLMSEMSERPEKAESQREKSIEREIVLKDFQKLRQTITTLQTDWATLIAKFNTEIQEKDAKIGALEEETSQSRINSKTNIKPGRVFVDQVIGSGLRIWMYVWNLVHNMEKLLHTVVSHFYRNWQEMLFICQKTCGTEFVSPTTTGRGRIPPFPMSFHPFQ